jgi:hypothetical protein
MKLFNFVLICGILATPVAASASSHNASKHLSQSGIFESSLNEGVFKHLSKPVDYLADQFLTASPDTFSRDSAAIEHQQFAKKSFQADTETTFKLAENNGEFGSHTSDLGHHFGNFSHGNEHHEHEGYKDRDDHVSLPVPEPETYLLMLAGLLMIGTAMRNKA